MSLWQRVTDPLVFVGNEAGGDRQFTEGFTARWVRPIIYGTDPIASTYEDEPVLWAVVDSTYYGSRDEDQGVAAYVEACYEITVCTDQAHIGDTELLALSEFEDVADDGDCSDAVLRQYAEEDEPPDDDWWNAVMDRNQHSSSPGFYLAVTP